MSFVLTSFGQVFDLATKSMRNFMLLHGEESGQDLSIPVTDDAISILTDALATEPTTSRPASPPVEERRVERPIEDAPDELDDGEPFHGLTFVPKS